MIIEGSDVRLLRWLEIVPLSLRETDEELGLDGELEV